MFRGREHSHIDADLGDQYLGGALLDARDRHQQATLVALLRIGPRDGWRHGLAKYLSTDRHHPDRRRRRRRRRRRGRDRRAQLGIGGGQRRTVGRFTPDRGQGGKRPSV